MSDFVDVPFPPSVEAKSFNCPHCSAHASQTWYDLFGKEADGTPFVVDQSFLEVLRKEHGKDLATWKAHREFLERALTGEVYTDSTAASQYVLGITNLHLSKCYACGRFSVWVYDRVLHPSRKFGDSANPDLPDHIRHDFDEARSISDLSPRGAAALLRLCVQKLCVHLGESGKKLDDDIAAMVASGLSVVVQQSLDAVRVIGNNAVHRGQIDISDDRAVARTLFRLVNLIAEKMISEPKRVQAVFDSLPEGAKQAINKRDGKLD